MLMFAIERNKSLVGSWADAPAPRRMNTEFPVALPMVPSKWHRDPRCACCWPISAVYRWCWMLWSWWWSSQNSGPTRGWRESSRTQTSSPGTPDALFGKATRTTKRMPIYARWNRKKGIITLLPLHCYPETDRRNGKLWFKHSQKFTSAFAKHLFKIKNVINGLRITKYFGRFPITLITLIQRKAKNKDFWFWKSEKGWKQIIFRFLSINEADDDLSVNFLHLYLYGKRDYVCSCSFVNVKLFFECK